MLDFKRRTLLKRAMLVTVAVTSLPGLSGCIHHHPHKRRHANRSKRLRLRWHRPRVLLVPRKRLSTGVLIVMPDGQEGVVTQLRADTVDIRVNGKIQTYRFEIEAS